MSIRLRLTLLYILILALALIGLSLALYVTVSQVTLRAIEDTLAGEAQRLVSSREFSLDQIDYRAKKFAAPETYIQTIRLDGSVADRTPNLEGFVLPLSQAGLQACQGGRPWTEVISTAEGRLLVYSVPVANYGRPAAGIVQLARSLTEQDQSLATLRNILFAGSAVVTLAVFGVAWAMSGAALRPIQRITETAQAIGAERDFTRRVDYTGPPDEIGRLSTTFNEMLTELQTAYRQAEQALQAQRRLVADASHELRTPLTTIRGNLGLLRRAPPIEPEDREAVIADMIDETDRLIRLANDLLALARADAGRPLRREPVPIQPLIDDVCRQAKLLGPGRTIECENTLDIRAAGDRDAIKQVLLILIDNALKYTPPGGTLALATAWTGEQVALSVRDTGPGIAPAALPHIFERFYRSDTARTGGGAGLGLAIAKELIEAQRGAIRVESRVGQGSVFTVTLPGVDPAAGV
ncbi:MAG TPA: HAMP domain-containing sensor histidine kinase [Anaerolineae bacterium]|nr:HAMP domain-containing sensor histidine kinase [Anaerolineae bacterium]